MTAAQYARENRPTMGTASEQLVQEYRDGKLKYHHTAFVRGYTSAKADDFASYNGRFGEGLAVFKKYTTSYSTVSYYIKQEIICE